MNYTGERIIPKLMKPHNGLLLEHIFRYEFAKDFTGERVLDIACGSGYGSEVLLKNNNSIKEIVGIDISNNSIEYARSNYNFPETSYYVDDCLNPNLSNIYGTFDTIISFETIEHFEGDEPFVKNLFNLLKPDGTLIISTPFGIGKFKPCSCPFHVYQYKEEEFINVLSPFKNITMYHQTSGAIEIPKADKKYYLMVVVCKKII